MKNLYGLRERGSLELWELIEEIKADPYGAVGTPSNPINALIEERSLFIVNDESKRFLVN